MQFIDEKGIQITELFEVGSHAKIVETYNLSRRMVGNIYHSMIEDIKKDNPEGKNLHYHLQSHEDYALYREWRGLKMTCARYMKQNFQEFCPLMKELGVDPQHFAEQFVDKDRSLKEQKLEAAALAQQWQLPQLDHHQKRHVCELRDETKKALIQEWHTSFREQPEKSHLIMTYSKADTTILNEEARQLLKQDGTISKEEYLFTTHKEDEDDFGDKIITTEEKHFAKGDRILFMKNDNGFGVRNGTLGTILEIDRHKIKAKLDNSNEVVSFSPKLYPYFDQGWAANIHKSQGVTVDRAFLLATHETYRNLAYVGMTRHREFIKVFGSKLDFWREEIFFKRLSSSQEKLSSLDYVKSYESINFPKKSSKLQEILDRLGNELEAIRFVSKQAWQSIAERFLGKIPEQQEIRIPQESINEYIRAKELLDNRENTNSQIQDIPTKLRDEIESEKHQIQSSQQLKLDQAPIEKIKALIHEKKFARTSAEKAQAEAKLKAYTQELYKQDPTFKNIRDKDAELTKQIRAILFEENRSKQIVKSYER
ncbi:MAG: hypothetical protein BGO77_04930 [Caedibacter sp. 37-49]|nr:MAG: hypothetical protein BGO77_04930 [Caedibacter sp. 37-49]